MIKRKKTAWTGEIVATIDMLYCVAILFMCVALVIINPPVTLQMDDRPVCRMALDIEWPASYRQDIDLWVKAPGEDFPVGYLGAYQQSPSMNLIDDVTNVDVEPLQLNDVYIERVCANKLIPGEYIVNLHYYAQRHKDDSRAVPVRIQLSYVDAYQAKMMRFFDGFVIMKEPTQETTVVRFTVDTNGKISPESFNTIPALIVPLEAINRSGETRR